MGSANLPDDVAKEQMALRELEQFFVYTLLQEMRKAMPETGLVEDKTARRMYTEMLDDAMSHEIAQSGKFGLAQQLAEQLHADRVRSVSSPSAARESD